MTSPENIQPRPDIQFTPETIDVSESMAEQGISPRPTHPASIQDDNGKKSIAQTSDPIVNLDPSMVVVVAADEETAKAWSKGLDTDARTWNGVAILRAIHMAVRRGLQAVVGK